LVRVQPGELLHHDSRLGEPRSTAASAHEVDGTGQGGHEQPEDPELEQHVRESASRRSAALELRCDDEDAPDDRNQADVEEGLDGDLVRPNNEAERVEQLGDDECEQNAVEDEHGDIDRTRPVMQLADKARSGPDEHKDAGGGEQKTDRRVEDDLERREASSEKLGQPGRAGLDHPETIRGVSAGIPVASLPSAPP
jgi:hypothetical protein